MSQITEFIYQYRINFKEHVDRMSSDRIPKMFLEKKCRKTFEKMEGFSFVTPVTGLNKPNTGKEDDIHISSFRTRAYMTWQLHIL
jgi:hypothetical protein